MDTKFRKYSCIGDTVGRELPGGVYLLARIEPDYDSRPDDDDFECYTEEDVQRWRDDEWSYCGIVVSVHVGEETIDKHAASLWRIELNFSDDGNSYLDEVADELSDEVDVLSILEQHAGTASAALAAVRAAVEESKAARDYARNYGGE
jgi:hypothetical protein